MLEASAYNRSYLGTEELVPSLRLCLQKTKQMHYILYKKFHRKQVLGLFFQEANSIDKLHFRTVTKGRQVTFLHKHTLNCYPKSHRGFANLGKSRFPQIHWAAQLHRKREWASLCQQPGWKWSRLTKVYPSHHTIPRFLFQEKTHLHPKNILDRVVRKTACLQAPLGMMSSLKGEGDAFIPLGAHCYIDVHSPKQNVRGTRATKALGYLGFGIFLTQNYLMPTNEF